MGNYFVTRIFLKLRFKPSLPSWRHFSFAALLALCGASHPAFASLYLQEGFNYPTGTLGTNSPWTNATSQIQVASGGLTYSNLPDFSPPANCAVVSPGSAAISYRPFNIAASNGPVYFSFLINFSVIPGNYYIAGLTQATNTPPGGASDDPLDLIDECNVSGTQVKFGVRAKGGTTYYSSTYFGTNTTVFIVLKYNFTNGTASMYLNPALGGVEPASPTGSSTSSSIVPDLSYLYLRSAATGAGTFNISALRVGSLWTDVTPASGYSVLSFTGPPNGTNAGSLLAPITVQVQNSQSGAIATNNVPITLSLNGGAFASGTTTVDTGSNGAAVFTNLLITNAGSYTLTASATGISAASSVAFAINPLAIDHYVLSVSTNVLIGQQFTVTGIAQDIYNNAVTTNNSTAVTLTSSTGNVLFDGNQNGVYGETGDNSVVLSAGGFSVNAKDAFAQTTTITATDANGKTGVSSPILVSYNDITTQGAELAAFLTSLSVDKYWLVGTSVNWLTGAPGGSGPNMTVGTDSHCSAFAGAVTELLGVYLLRQPDASDINLANNQAVWLPTNTAGWFQIALPLNAQHMVNTGLLVVASYKSSSGSGHIAVLRPTNRTDTDVNTYGPEECQSGDNNYADTNIMAGFSEHPGAFPNNITYWGHTVTYPINPIGVTLTPVVMTNSSFKMTVNSVVGRIYQVQSSADLKNWSNLLAFTNSNNFSLFYTNATVTDTSASVSRKYYRTISE